MYGGTMHEKTSLLFRFILVTISICLFFEGSIAQDEARLIGDLLNNYNKHVRPAKNTEDVIKIEFGLNLMHILDLDEENNILTINAWRTLSWHDYTLEWNPDEYGGVSTIRVPFEIIWTPDILLYNTIGERISNDPKALIVISSDGRLLWVSDQIIKSPCAINRTNIPFNEPECKLKFGSWTYNGNQIDIDLDPSEVGLSDYSVNNKWSLIEATGKRHVALYACCPEPYPSLNFNLKLRRNVNFLPSFIHIIPSKLLTCLSLFVYWVPPEYSARIFLCMAIFISFLAMFIFFTQSLPASATEIPPLGMFYQFNMLMVTFSILVSIIVMNLYQRNVRQKPVPKWMKVLFINGFGRILCVQNPKRKKLPEKTSDHSIPDNSLYPKIDQADGTNEVMNENADSMEKIIREDTELYEREWRIVGYVLDKLFFIIHLVTILIYAISIMT